MNDREFWMTAYLAAMVGRSPDPAEEADRALVDYQTRFPCGNFSKEEDPD